MQNPPADLKNSTSDTQFHHANQISKNGKLLALSIFIIAGAAFSGMAIFSVLFYGLESSIQWGVAAAFCTFLIIMIITGLLDRILKFLTLVEITDTDEDIKTRSWACLVGLWLIVIGAATIAICLLFIVQEFMAIYAVLGENIPLLTALLPYNIYSWGFVAISLISLIPALNISLRSTYTTPQKKRFKFAFRTLLGAFIFMFLLTILAMYLPLFVMGLAVN